MMMVHLMMRSFRPVSLVTVVSLLCLAHSAPRAQSPPVAYGPSCSALAGVLIASATVTFTRRFAPGTFDPRQRTQQTPSAAPPFRDLPEFCRAELTAGSSSAFVSAEVWIPTQSWNGKLMMVGRNRSGTAFDFGRMAVALSAGFATASLDGATPAAIHEATSAVNQLLATYLGPEARWIYWSGCAASARDGLVAADRYPGDFDGILAGGLSEAVPPVAGSPGRTTPQLGLEAYRARGGKVLVYDTSAGAASALLPLGNNDAIRLVLTPGQPNCPDVDDGRTAGMVRALESWVERGKTPDQTGARPHQRSERLSTGLRSMTGVPSIASSPRTVSV
jgi:tannase/feruloyl esterase